MTAVPYRRIATEEGWATPELIRTFQQAAADGSIDDPGFRSLWGFFGNSPSPRARDLLRRIQDVEGERLRDMDALGIDMQILSLTAPGVQVFDAATASALAIDTNDQLAATIARHPTRFAGLAAIAPHAPEAAARELERAVTKLGLKGAVINSHTLGLYLDDPRYWEVFGVAERLGVPIYLHPNTPSAQMIEPFLSRGLAEAIFGFACETALHVMRLIVAGLFDRYPKLQFVLGHLGEGLPYWLYRIDFMHAGIVRSQRCAGAQPLQRTPSEVLRQNFHYTTSGMCWEPPVMYVHQLMGPERVMYAMDYPYQVVAEEVAAMDALPMSAEDKALFFEGNARRVFGLDT